MNHDRHWIEDTAAGPWNYDMSAAPDDGHVIYWCKFDDGYWVSTSARDFAIAWAMINLPEDEDDY